MCLICRVKRLPDVVWFTVAGLAVRSEIYAFGLMIVGVFLQKHFPDIIVGTPVAAASAGLIAGVVSGVVNFCTLATLNERSRLQRLTANR